MCDVIDQFIFDQSLHANNQTDYWKLSTCITVEHDAVLDGMPFVFLSSSFKLQKINMETMKQQLFSMGRRM